MVGTELSQNPNRIINVGIIGAGYGLTSLLPVIESISGYKVVCVASSPRIDGNLRIGTPSSRSDLFTTPKDLINNRDIEVVLIASPPSTHEEYAIAALASGKNIYCEKPVGLNADSTRRILDAAEQSKEIFTVGYQFRFDPMIQWLKSQILTGDLGEIRRIEIRWETAGATSTPLDSWRNQLNLGGGVLRDFGSHVFDYLSFIEAINFREADGESKGLRGFTSNISGTDIQDINFLGRFGRIELNCIISRTSRKPIGHDIRVIGTKAEVHASHHPPFGNKDLILEIVTRNRVRKIFNPDEISSPESPGMILSQLDSRQFSSRQLFINLAREIRGKSNEFLATLEDALLSQKLVDEAESVLFGPEFKSLDSRIVST